VPILKRLNPSPRTRRVLWAVVHYALLAAVLVLLWFVGRRYDLDRYLDSRYPALHPVWLPLLALFLYLFVRVGLWLYWALGPDRSTGEFPDLDAAWTAITAELERTGIDPRSAPVFLVFGGPVGGVDALFAAARVPLLVRAWPTDLSAAVHAYAHPRGVFVAAEGASLLGRYVERFSAGSAPSADPGAVRTRLLAEPDAVYRLAARLRYLCRLIARDRDPYCPVNGFLWVVPADAVATDADAEEAGLICLQDLKSARAALQLWCPSVFVIADVDRPDGADHFLKRLPVARRAEPLGVTFPVVPNTDPEGYRRMLADAAGWLCRSAVAAAVVGLLRTERPDESDPWQSALDNAPPVLMARAAAERERPLVRFLREATATPPDEPPLAGGVYLAATGGESHQQAFAAAALERLTDLQDAVAWAPDARAEESSCNRLAAVVAVVLLGWLAVLVFELLKERTN
jgi:hypothetical protein